MKRIGVGLLLLWALALPVMAAGGEAAGKGKTAADARIQALLLFIVDVEMCKGMFYGQYAYCAPRVHPLIASQSYRAWQRENAPYLAAEKRAEQQYIAAMKARGGTAQWARHALAGLKKKYYDSMYHDRGYINKKVVPQKNKMTACSSYLGTLVSDSMSFRHISPTGYQYWQAHYAH